jgi:hypothetical protein
MVAAMRARTVYAMKPEPSAATAFLSIRAATIVGSALANAPIALVTVPATLQREKIAFRSRAATVSASAACSTGRKRLTLPAEGLSVPATAMTKSGQKARASYVGVRVDEPPSRSLGS